ncbi:HlyD family secretion protein [Phreatobacter oligotrophus]|jgi:HlyD family secretion protein|uniref:HlyD family secretion protein n=1 Tax=Phreatobacter oligotrophus TaxID=1122261 RepID=UPI0023522ED0|nr:efflux RND transporter periplasmic adaptor subunit [Phreatobacter oligotrophus]MBX9991580.1 efflux RND transporter periplasmic adaptor subunit [Phreatobacter oligotrophus]
MRRWAVLVLIIAALGGAGWWFTGPGSLAVAEQPAWRTAKADRGDVIAAVNATGTINPISTVVVGSQVSGQVLEILADYNTQVEPGQVLARLDPTQVKAKLDGARADLLNVRAARQVQLAQIEQARADITRSEAARVDAVAKLAQVEAQLAEAERNYVRQRELGARGAVAQAVIDTARATAETQRAARDSARAQIESAEASKLSLQAALKVAEAQIGSVDAQISQKEAVVRQIEVDLSNTEIRSPVKGTVVQRQVELGQTVAASLQAPTLFLVAQDLRSMEIYANVDEADVGRVRSGQTVTFSVNAYPGREFTGEVKLVRLGSQTVQNVVIYTAIISFSNPRMELLPGMTATLRVITDRRENVLRVPNAALRWRPAGAAPAEPRPQPQAGANPFGPPMGGPPMGGGRGGPGGGGGGGAQGGRQIGEFVETLKTELTLDASQRERIDAVVAETRPLFRTLGDPSMDRNQRIERFREIRAEMARKIEAVLSADQRKAFAEIRARYEGNRGADGGLPGRVFVVGADGKPQAVSVRVGVSDGAMTEVLSGDLEAGRELIIGTGQGPGGSAPAPRGFRMF